MRSSVVKINWIPFLAGLPLVIGGFIILGIAIEKIGNFALAKWAQSNLLSILICICLVVIMFGIYTYGCVCWLAKSVILRRHTWTTSSSPKMNQHSGPKPFNKHRRYLNKKLYRAFPQLDQFTDKQCELLMRRVNISNNQGWLMVLTPPIFVCLLGFGMTNTIYEAHQFIPQWAKLNQDVLTDLTLAVTFITMGPVWLLVRDVLLRRALKRAIALRIDKVRCFDCKYVLIATPPSNNQITCPECGLTHTLDSLGLQDQDLLTSPSSSDQTITMQPNNTPP